MKPTLLLAVLPVVCWSTPALAQEKADAKVRIFAAEEFYKNQPGAEKEWVGVLKKIDRGDDVVGIGRFNPFWLDMGKDRREVYAGSQGKLLEPYVGRKVRLHGKAVELEVVGRVHREIWTGWLIVLGDAKGTGVGKPAGKVEILAQAPWRFGSTDPDARQKPTRLVIRSAADLVTHTPYRDRDALSQFVEAMATADIAKQLKVKSIDWKKQMLIVVTAGTRPTGGWSVRIQGAAVADGKLEVSSSIAPPKGFATQAFTHPGTMILVERFEGPVVFRSVGRSAPPRKIRP